MQHWTLPLIFRICPVNRYLGTKYSSPLLLGLTRKIRNKELLRTPQGIRKFLRFFEATRSEYLLTVFHEKIGPKYSLFLPSRLSAGPKTHDITLQKHPNYLQFFLYLRFTPHKAEQPLQAMELQEKEEYDNEKHIRRLIRISTKITGAFSPNII